MLFKLFESTKWKLIPILLLVFTIVGGIVVYYRLRTFSFVQLQQEDQNILPTPMELLNEEENSRILSDIQENGISCDFVEVDGAVTKDKCVVDKVIGNYAKGSMPRAYWIALKSEDKWKVVITGNGIPGCIEVDKFSIPAEIYGNCIESSGQLRLKSST